MFKQQNLSPLNPNKDKFTHNNNYNHLPNNDFANGNAGYHQQNQMGYQYSNKGMYSNNNNGTYHHQRQQNGVSENGYNAPLSPLSPNITKNPTSPTAKIKMFSTTLNKKQSSGTGNNGYGVIGKHSNMNAGQINSNTGRQNKSNLSKIGGVKNLVLDLSESMDLKCDQVLDYNENDMGLLTPKNISTPNIPTNNNYSHLKTGNTYKQQQQTQSKQRTKSSNIPVLRFQQSNQQVDDLKCDQVLDPIQGENNYHYNNNNNNPSSQQQQQNINQWQHKSNLNNNNNVFKHNGNKDKSNISNDSNLLLAKKNTQPVHQQPHSTTNIKSNPTIQLDHSSSPVGKNQHGRSVGKFQEKHSNEKSNNSSQIIDLNNNNEHIIQNQQKTYQQIRSCLQRTQALLYAYKKRVEEAEQKSVFLERENEQLRKCLYGEKSDQNDINSNNIITNINNSNMNKNSKPSPPSVKSQHQYYNNMTSAGRYQGVN